MKLLEVIRIVNDSFSTNLSEFATTEEPHSSSKRKRKRKRKKGKKVNIIYQENRVSSLGMFLYTYYSLQSKIIQYYHSCIYYRYKLKFYFEVWFLPVVHKHL